MATSTPNNLGLMPWGSLPDLGGTQSTGLAGSLDRLGFGGVMQIGGSLLSAAGAYAQAQNAKHVYRTQQLDAEFQQSMSVINQRNAALDAQAVLDKGAVDIAFLGMQYSQEKAGVALTQASSGVDASTGSAAEVTQSVEYAKRLSMYFANIDRVRNAGAARLQVTELGNRAAIAGVSARNLRSSAKTIRPEAEAFGTLLGGLGSALGAGRYR